MKTRLFISTLMVCIVTFFVHAAETDPVEGRVQMLKKQLDLTSEQVEQVRSILKTSFEQAKKDRALNAKDPQAMRAAEQSRRELENQQIENILTEAQRRKFAEIREKQRVGRRGGPAGEQLQMLIDRLGLTDAQIEQIAPILTETHEKMQALRQNASGNRREMFGKMRKIRDAQDKKIEALLTDDQKKIFKEIKKERQKERARRRPRGGRGGGMRPRRF